MAGKDAPAVSARCTSGDAVAVVDAGSRVLDREPAT
jgi:hypothetical protein